jgi:hypothetical protein
MKYIAKTEKDFVENIDDMKRVHMDKTSVFPVLKFSTLDNSIKEYVYFETAFDTNIKIDEFKDMVFTAMIKVDKELKIIVSKDISYKLENGFSELIMTCNPFMNFFEVHYINGFIRFIFPCDKSKINYMEEYSEKNDNIFKFIKNYNYH